PAGEVEVSGHVLDPAGKPFAGAKVCFRRLGPDFGDPPPPAQTDGEGRFRRCVRRPIDEAENEGPDRLRGAVLAVGKGHGPGLVFTTSTKQLANVTVRLVKDVPIEGRVLGLEGQPVAGVRVQVQEVFTQTRDAEDLKPWLEALRNKKEPSSP